MRALPLLLLLLLVVESRADEPIRLLREFTLSPDGAEIYFAWRGDIWSHPLQGGSAKRLTAHPAIERFPRLSPNGKTLAFVSNRTGANQVYTMPVAGGDPKQQTHHSEGSLISDWYPDGRAMLIKGNRDNFWRAGDRYFRRVLDGSSDRMLFDGYGHSAQVSPDGKQLLFCREGVSWTRKGYRGPQSCQIWLFDFASRVFTRQTEGDLGERSPVWTPDASGYFFTAQRDGAFNLFRRQLKSGQTVQLTRFRDDGVLFPVLSRNGAVIVFRVGFDLYRMDAKGGEPDRIKLVYRGDAIHERVARAQLARASQVAFSDDGREVAFIAGGDLWVMDTELKEPRRITRTPEEERDPVFAPDHKSILFVSDKGGQADLWTAKRADEKKHWWRNEAFELKQLTDDDAPESDPRFVKGGRVAFTNLRGDLWTMKADGTDRKLVFDSWNPPSFDFSPDGKWVAYAIDDNDFNRDIWIRAADGSGEPVNVTRHPDWESSPTFSPDSKMLAFVGRRNHEEVDLHFVFLRKQDDDESKRDRTIEKAEKKMKGRKDPSKAKKKAPPKSPFQKWVEDWAKKQKAAKAKKPAPKEKKPAKPTIDFDGISDRIRRIEIAGVSESGPFWSHDSKKLVFRAKIDGKDGLWTVSPPDEIKPKSLSTTKGSGWRWLKEGNQIVGLAGGRPTSLSASGKPTAFAFRVPNEVDLPARNRAAFDLCWRVMRDSWYDERFNNRDWNAVRAKYREMAGTVTVDELDQVVDMMLGELNGSHLGFSARGPTAFRAPAWRDVTPHFGTRFDDSFEGPGLKVTSVIEGSPAWRSKSRIEKDEVILSADGKPLDPGRDLASQLNGRLDRDVRLRVKDRKGKERDVVIRPMSYGQVRRLLYDEWQQRNRDYVAKRSDGKLGYLHVRGMNWSSFEKFEAELYKVGHGKDGLLIDVRDNSGGFTADHLLTVLCQPVHAVTVPRGGKVGYPQGRMVYARWHKPVTVLCNQNSFSNAEIFAHAIQSLKRGRVVGVRTAGGVISTGGRGIMEFGFLRLPFRGWFLAKNGRDMELNGCVPEFEIWPQPEEWATGVDRQLAKGVDLLASEVKELRERPQRPLRFRSGAEVERGTEEE